MELTGHGVRFPPHAALAFLFLHGYANLRPHRKRCSQCDSIPVVSTSHPAVLIAQYVGYSRGSIGAADINIVVLWNTYGNCANYLELNGHKGAILDLHWSRDSRIVFSASTDSLLASWDAENGARIRRYVGHADIINAFDVARRGPEVMVSGSDDGTIGVCYWYYRYGDAR